MREIDNDIFFKFKNNDGYTYIGFYNVKQNENNYLYDEVKIFNEIGELLKTA